jgi:ankyrin repeat protein
VVEAAKDGPDPAYGEIVEALLTAGADPDLATSSGQTPTRNAAAFGLPKLLETLASSIADLDLPDEDGMTPLHHAVLSGNAEVVRVLLKCEADPTVVGPHGLTALHIAAEVGRRDMVDLLLGAGANAQSRTTGSFGTYHEGATPADIAELRVHGDLAKFLRPDATRQAAKAAGLLLDYAVMNGYDELVAALKATPELAESMLPTMAARGMDLRAIILLVRDKVDKAKLRSWIRAAVPDDLERMVYLVMV